MTMYNTVGLDRTKWDLFIDSAGNIGLCTPPYALAQDVASACRTFLGECWYDTTKGLPYFEELLGRIPASALLTGYMEQAALTVPGVVSAQCQLTQYANRQVNGFVSFVTEAGTQGIATV